MSRVLVSPLVRTCARCGQPFMPSPKWEEQGGKHEVSRRYGVRYYCLACSIAQPTGTEDRCRGETKVNSIKKRPATYRLTPELDKAVTDQAKKLGISKNAFVQLTLSKVLLSSTQPTGTDGPNTP